MLKSFKMWGVPSLHLPLISKALIAINCSHPLAQLINAASDPFQISEKQCTRSIALRKTELSGERNRKKKIFYLSTSVINSIIEEFEIVA